jgi:N-acyl-D-amino-acid deacylase
MWGDIVIFDAGTVADAATFESPHQLSRGLSCVLVNGEIVFAEGKWTGLLPGRNLYGKGKKA